MADQYFLDVVFEIDKFTYAIIDPETEEVIIDPETLEPITDR